MIADGGLKAGDIESAARIIADLRLRRKGSEGAIDGLSDACRPRTLDQAYAIQERARPLIGEGLGPAAGYKVGATAKVMQERLGIHFPCAGTLFRDRIYDSGATIRRADYRHLGVECEIGVRVGRALPGRPGGYDRDSVHPAIAAVFVSIEIVEHRFTDVRAVGAETHVADDFYSAGAVLGPEHPLPALDLTGSAPGEIRVDGALAFAGHVRDILGHPLISLAWLANHLVARGTPLQAGDIVTLGSISPGTHIPEPAMVEARFEGLGSAIVDIV
ncbi:MAG: fumarylacetoacetate hydrolase family protein [Hyphomicrobiaceae bacterium]